MAQVTVSVNGRRYTVGCDDGEEEHVEYLAEFIDKRVRELVEAVGQVGEERLLVMAALLIAEDLDQAYSEIEALRARAAGAKEAVRSEPPGGAPEAAVESLAERLESIAAQLENA